MKICIFYSWQSDYEEDCQQFIGASLKAAVDELNNEQNGFEYYIVRGGGGLVGSQEIKEQIDNALRYEACIVVSDYTHVGPLPEKDKEGRFIKRRALPNPNVIDETARAKERVGTKQIIKVNNTYYGNYRTNISMYFDIQNERFPLAYYYHKTDNNENKRKKVFDYLTRSLKESIVQCTEEFLKNQKVRFSPLVPLMNIYTDKMFKAPFLSAEKFKEIQIKIKEGKSFRLLALPGIGKTRMVCEAFRGVDMNLYYCDCKNKNIGAIIEAIGKLLENTKEKQILVIDNCDQTAHAAFLQEIQNHYTECQVITLYYNVREIDDTDIEVVRITPKETPDVVKFLLDNVKDLPESDKEAITEIAGGFPLMVNLLIDQYRIMGKIASISQAELFNRMLNINEQNADDLEKKKVMTAFSIFKYIGLYGSHERQGKFIANNQIITPLLEKDEEQRFTRFLNVYAEFSRGDLLDREGNMVLMRPVPLAIYLAKKWYQIQTVETISMLIGQINALQDEVTKTSLIDSLSRRITLLADVPLAQELVGALLNPKNSPFLTEEVVLSSLGSRLFLAFSEVNPEACAFALYRMIANKNDEEIKAVEPARRNLAWALDHLTFDKRSFRWAMLTLARFSLVETENQFANNTTGLFVDRFPILLPGTEVDLMTRIDVLKELSKDSRYRELVKKSLLRALGTGPFQRSGGAEKQGTKKLKDYIPTFHEVSIYYNASLDMLLELAETQQDIDDIAKTLANNAHGYYTQGESDFLFRGLEIIAPKKNYVWEEMKSSLSYLIDYNARKGSKFRLDEIEDWKKKLTKEDYVYKLLHLGNDIMRRHNSSYQDNIEVVHEEYGRMAKELIDQQLYKDPIIISGILQGECFYYNEYGFTLSSYAKEVGVQKELLDILLDYILYKEVSRNGENLLLYFMMNVEDKDLLEHIYDATLKSEKKRLLPAMYAIKNEGEDKLAQLFGLLDNDEICIKDFSGYFNYHTLDNFDVKYVAGRLLDYGAEGAGLVLSHCHNLLFGDMELDADYQAIARRCLMLVNLQGFQMNDYLYLQSMNNYMVKHHDEEMALHIQDLQEKSLKDHYSRDNYYLGRLYRKVFRRYPELLKSRLFELLDDEKERHSWIDLLSTGYPQEKGEEEPMYMLIPIDEWFVWLEKATANDRAYALAMMFSYSIGSEASPEMLRLLDGYWCDEVRDAISCRFHSYSWTGTGIPLFKERIAICKDFVSKLTNLEAKEWFKKDIGYWEKEIEEELLNNAHERAIFD